MAFGLLRSPSYSARLASGVEQLLAATSVIMCLICGRGVADLLGSRVSPCRGHGSLLLMQRRSAGNRNSNRFLFTELRLLLANQTKDGISEYVNKTPSSTDLAQRESGSLIS